MLSRVSYTHVSTIKHARFGFRCYSISLTTPVGDDAHFVRARIAVATCLAFGRGLARYTRTRHAVGILSARECDVD